MYEVIPFNEFLLSNIYPSFPVSTWLDGGLTFLLSTGSIYIGLVVLDKLGIPINKTAVKITSIAGLIISALWAVFTNPLFRKLLFGF